MKINLGVKPYLFPMPVLMIATYGEDDRVNVMNMAWGGICDDNKVALNISDTHKTADNLRARRAFTISVANQDHLEAADYFGMVTGNKVPDKFERTGLHAVRSERVDAPMVTEFPLTIECRVVDMKTTDGTMRVVGEIVNVLADETVLDERGRVDPTRLNAILFDPFQSGYYAIGEPVGQAWKSGAVISKRDANA